jgi:hypothetical protein
LTILMVVGDKSTVTVTAEVVSPLLVADKGNE